MRWKFTSFMLVVGMVLLGMAFIDRGHTTTVAASESATWLSGPPSISLVSEVAAGDVSTLDEAHCTHMMLPVVRRLYQQLLANNEDHCMVRTSAGLIDDVVKVWQPRGFSKAYPVDNQNGGHPTVVPVPYYPSALLASPDPIYPGVNIGLYKMLTSHLVYNQNVLSPRFSLLSPDLYFRYPNNRLMAFVGSGSFSGNGRYWVAESVSHGFVRVNMTTLQMTTFAENSPRTTTGVPLGAEAEISPSGKFAAIAYNAPQSWGHKYFKVIDVDSCGNSIAAYSVPTSTCRSIDYWPRIAQEIPDLLSISHVAFANDDSLSFLATTSQGTSRKYHYYVVSPAGQPTRLEEYLALGDSFASGEGTFNYISGTEDGLNKCHHSIHSYPYIMGMYTGSLASVACSGAVMRNINGDTRGLKTNQLKGLLDSDIPDSQKATARAVHTPGIVRQLDFISQDDPQIVTISIGGNDVGFSDIIKRCIIPFNDFSSSAQNCYQTYEDRKELVDTINEQFDNLVQTYGGLRSGDPTRRVYVVGYPQLVSPTGLCDVNVRLSKSDRVFASQLIDYLDSVVERAAAQAGVYYVDTQDAFDGHKLCEPGDKAANGLTGGHDEALLIGNESYHPNKLGHELFASRILSSTHNLTLPMPKPHTITPPDESTLAILKAPKTGRTMYEIVNTGEDIVYVTAHVLAPGASKALLGVALPDSDFRAELHSNPINLGILHAGTDGIIRGDLSIPADTPVGIHTLHLYGKNIFGDPVDIQRTVYVESSITDYDGDGVLNAVDSCLGIPQSGQDQDADGVDDACDPLITAAPAQNGPVADNRDDETSAAISAPPATPQAENIVMYQPAEQALQSAGSGNMVQTAPEPAATTKVLGSFTAKPDQKTPLQKTSGHNLIQNLGLVVGSLVIAIGLYQYVLIKKQS